MQPVSGQAINRNHHSQVIQPVNQTSNMTTPYILTGLGAAFGVAFSGIGSASASAVAASYAMASNGLMSHVPIVIAGVLGIYGLIVGAILSGDLTKDDGEIGIKQGCANLAAGLAVGLACYASGMGMTMFLANSLYGGDYGVRKKQNAGSNGHLQALLPSRPEATSLHEPYPVSAKFVMMLVFLEAIGLYGLIVGLMLIG